jgi:hypothetical protein
MCLFSQVKNAGIKQWVILTVYGSFSPPGLMRCRGDFNPKQALNDFNQGAGSGIQLEEVACMKMCKRGPNVRMV